MLKQEPRKGGWIIVALLFAFMMVNFADKAIVGLAAVPIMTELKLTPKEFGLVASSFFFLFSISAVVTGFIVNRVQTKTALLAMGLVWAFVQFPMVGSVGVGTLIACRVILGAGEGPAYPVALHSTYKWFPDEQRALPSAVILQGAAVGVIIVVPALTWIITSYSWHYAFGALGIVGLIWVALWAMFGKEGDEPIATSDTEADYLPYRTLLLNPTNLASWCAYFGAYFAVALVLSWFTAYLEKGLEFPRAVAGNLTVLPPLAGFFAVIAGSFISERLMKRGTRSRVARGILSGICVAVGGLALLAVPYISNIPVKMIFLVVGVSLPTVIFALSPAILAEFTPPRQRGAMLAINSAVGSAAGIVAPFLMGSIIDRAVTPLAGYDSGFAVCGAVTLAGGLIGLLFLRPETEKLRVLRTKAAVPMRASA